MLNAINDKKIDKDVKELMNEADVIIADTVKKIKEDKKPGTGLFQEFNMVAYKRNANFR